MKFEVVTSVVAKRRLVCALGLGLVVALAPMSVTAGSVFGTVQVNGPVWSSTGAADWAEVSATRPLVAGDKYRTGDEGYLLADLGDQGVVGMYGNTEITAGHHDRIRQIDDLFELIERQGLFQLRHDPGPPGDDLARLSDILGPLDKRQRHPIDAQLQAETQILMVFFR